VPPTKGLDIEELVYLTLWQSPTFHGWQAFPFDALLVKHATNPVQPFHRPVQVDHQGQD
jgi:hypothetical protein